MVNVVKQSYNSATLTTQMNITSPSSYYDYYYYYCNKK